MEVCLVNPHMHIPNKIQFLCLRFYRKPELGKIPLVTTAPKDVIWKVLGFRPTHWHINIIWSGMNHCSLKCDVFVVVFTVWLLHSVVDHDLFFVAWLWCRCRSLLIYQFAADRFAFLIQVPFSTACNQNFGAVSVTVENLPGRAIRIIIPWQW